MQPRSKKRTILAQDFKENAMSNLEQKLLTLAIKASSQESRFHTEAIATRSRETDLYDVCIQVGDTEVLSDAHLRLKEGKKYGLVGRNGSGKSTLMRAMSEGLIPGLPVSVRFVLVSQLETSLLGQEGEGSALHALLQYDEQRVAAQREYDLLTSALDSEDSTQLRNVVQLLLRERRAENLQEARKMALKQSGARGKGARMALLSAEKAHDESNQDLTFESDSFNWHNEALDLLERCTEILKDREADTLVTRAHVILHGLGFTEEMIQGRYKYLSGGWKCRLALASALLQTTDVLLLDEPVNYLDLPSVLWLENYIMESTQTIVTVAHDIDFMNNVTEELIVLKDKALIYFDGNLTEYEKTKKEKEKHAIRQQESLDKRRDQIEKSIQEGKKQARKTGDENRQRMVKSREKKLEDRWGVERNAAGHRFKLNRDFGGYHFSSRKTLEIAHAEAVTSLSLPEPDFEKVKGALLHVENVAFRYRESRKSTVQAINLTVHPGDRVALIGPNGHGKVKSTILGLLFRNLEPTKGMVEHNAQMRIGYYRQDSVEELHSSSANGETCRNALEHFMAHCSSPYFSRNDTARAFLAQFNLRGRILDGIPIEKLSGGQKAKLKMAELLCGAPHLLILDEVTTHLDSDTVRALSEALHFYTGAIILVSHDRYAIRAIVEGKKDEIDEAWDKVEGTSHSCGEKDMMRVCRSTFLIRNGRMRLLRQGVDEYVQQMKNVY